VSRRVEDGEEAVRRTWAEERSGRAVTTADGRNIDPETGALLGEGAQMSVRRPGAAQPAARGAAETAPAPAAESTTYYGLPAIKRPVWKWYIPAYLYVGGLAGASAALAAACELTGDRRLRTTAGRARWVAAGGAAVSAGLLIADLGRPSRFLNMLRVFRPTSPMNMGTWILSGFGAASGAAALLAPRPGAAAMLGRAAGVGAGVLGLPLTSYTGVLLANTTVPIWRGARRTLPWLFAASAACSAASLLQLLGAPNKPAARVVRRLGVLGKAAELVAAEAVTRELARRGPGPVAQPLRRGRAGLLWRAAKVMTAVSLALDILPGEGRGRARAAGVLGTLGTLALRFAVVEGGRRSADDPRATFEPQRAQRDARRAPAAGQRRPAAVQPGLVDPAPG
jgi:formate-dependent nitrite reductase membrane component NrfD